MEQARYWMWAKQKTDSNPRILAPPPTTTTMNCYGDSWEEQAFAEDAAGALGGCVWPPRSYSCSFCRREFRSAQALGGHMNVHRRDRARLKQSPTDQLVLPQNHAFDPSNYSPQICSFLCNNPSPSPNPNPNPEFSDTRPFVTPPMVRDVSSPVVDEDKTSTTTLCFFSSPLLVHRNDKDQSTVVNSSLPPSWSSFIAEKKDRALDAAIKNEDKKLLVTVELESIRAHEKAEDCVTTDDLSMSLNLKMTANCRSTQTSDEEVASCKRRRIETKVPLSNFLQDRCLEVLKPCSGSVVEEVLDLELRLGNAPKVK